MKLDDVFRNGINLIIVDTRNANKIKKEIYDKYNKNKDFLIVCIDPDDFNYEFIRRTIYENLFSNKFKNTKLLLISIISNKINILVDNYKPVPTQNLNLLIILNYEASTISKIINLDKFIILKHRDLKTGTIVSL